MTRSLLVALAIVLAPVAAGAASEMTPGEAFGTIFTLFVVVLPLYFLPWIVASHRRHPQRFAIGVLNLLLGWTVLGWVGALVWSATAVSRPAAEPARRRPLRE